MEAHQLPIASGVILVSVSAGAAVAGYPQWGILLIAVVAGLLSIAVGVGMAPKPPRES